MGTWKTGHNDDIIGDNSADTVTVLCRDINALYTDKGIERPDLGEFLAALIISCNQYIERSPRKDLHPIRGLATTLRGKAEKVAQTNLPKIADELIDLMREAILRVEEDYVSSVDRKPRLTELFACFSFVLGYRPEDYISGMEGESIALIEETL